MSAPKGRSGANKPPGSPSAGEPARPLPSAAQAQGQSISFTDPPHRATTDSPTSDARPTSRGDAITASTSTAAAGSDAGDMAKTKKKKHRSGKKKRNRRQSFATTSEDVGPEMPPMERPSLLDTGVGRTRSEQERERESFYRLGSVQRSTDSLDSEALLDHRYVNLFSVQPNIEFVPEFADAPTQ